jgi:hypothetical protein
MKVESSPLQAQLVQSKFQAVVPTRAAYFRGLPSMIKTSRILPVVLLAPLLALAGAAHSSQNSESAGWLVGTWKMISDEDHGTLESIVFRADGRFATYDEQCKEHTNSYFVRNGMVFLVVPQAKGPVALILVPDAKRSSMTFTSPRTLNNAVYKRSEEPRCLQKN